MERSLNMNSPKWFLVATGLLILNAGAVVTTGYWRHAGTDDPNRGESQQIDEPISGESQEISNITGDSIIQPAGKQAAQQAGTEADKNMDDPKAAPSASPLDAIPIPDALPVIPSLADPESLKNDPGFQEFRRLFAKEEESWSEEPPLLRSHSSDTHNQAYFETLHQRLETVEQLCSAARNITREAALHARSSQQEKSQEFVRMTTQLREIAAKLLVSEL